MGPKPYKYYRTPPSSAAQAAAPNEFEQEKRDLLNKLAYARQTNSEKHQVITLTQLGNLHRKHDKLDAALKYLLEAYAIEPENAYVLNGLGMIYFDMGQYEEAIKYYEAQMSPIVTMSNLARAHRFCGEYSQALHYVERVLAKAPNNAVALNELGILLRLQGDYPQALATFQQLLDLDPKNKQALDGLAMTYRAMKDYAQALATYQQQLKVYPNNKQALDGLAITYREMGNYAQALTTYQQKLKVYPNDKQALDGKAMTYREMGNYAQALVTYQQKLKVYPNDKEALDGLAITYREKKDYAQALATYQQQLDRDPTNKQALDGLAITYREMGNYAQALATYQQQLDRDPTDKQALDGLAITYREMGNYAQALAHHQALLKLHPGNEYALRGLKKTYSTMVTRAQEDAAQGEREAAVELLEQVIAAEAGHKAAWQALQATFQAMGATPQAINRLKKRLLLNPTEEFARAQLQASVETFEKEDRLKEASDLAKFLQETQPKVAPALALEKPFISWKERVEQLEQKLKRQEAELMRVQQLWGAGQVALGMAHEIRQALQVISLTAENCSADLEGNIIDPPQIIADLAMIAQKVKEADYIIEYLRTLSRKSKVDEVELVDVNQVLEDSLQAFQQRLRGDGITLERQLAVPIPLIKANKLLLSTVFNNLIINAREALTSQSAKLLRFETKVTAAQVEVSVMDTGPGIKPEDLAHIFEAFVSTKEMGTGLGLYISQDIIQKSGGTITVTSTVGVGTTFVIRFPFVSQEQNDESGQDLSS